MSSDNISDEQILELIRKDPERLARLQLEARTSVDLEENDRDEVAPKRRKSKKADDVEAHIQDLLHQSYGSAAISTVSQSRFDFTRNVDSTENINAIKFWKKYLIQIRPEKYRNEDWSDKRLNNRLKTYFRSMKAVANMSEEKKSAKQAMDRRRNRCNDKKERRIAALRELVKNKIIPKNKYEDILEHLQCPSEEETDEQDEEKTIKLASSPHRSKELVDYYKLIDNQRASRRKGGQATAIQIKRKPWPDHAHSPPANAAPWTIEQPIPPLPPAPSPSPDPQPVVLPNYCGLKSATNKRKRL